VSATTRSDAAPLPRQKRDVKRSSPALILAALGVVFGDIGTSPLYTLKTCFTTAHVGPQPVNAIGITSVLLWTLVVVVCFKYVGTIMRVDHDGEGGILALLALALPQKQRNVPLRVGALVWIAVIGAAMLFGDGVVTPAISVISAVEGIGVATPAAANLIVPLSVGILIALFCIQSRGTERVGKIFGPVMVLWFVAIAASGLVAIVHAPAILRALDPRSAALFVVHHGVFGFLIFGAVVLAVTGVEALYADLSHFGRRPIFRAWYAIVFPALVCNYLGQGAVIISDPQALDISSPFFALTPGAALYPMVALATAATVIASQALISGAFTLAEQAINLNLWPRLSVFHTSRQSAGQVYVPAVNVALGIACVLLVLAFRSSDRLAAAYGLAVSATMLATSIVFYYVVTKRLRWKKIVAVPLVIVFVAIDGTFVAASLPKFLDGAWVPLLISAVLVTSAMTWLSGRRCIATSLSDQALPLEEYLRDAPAAGTAERTGRMVFLTGDPDRVPFVQRHRWLRTRAEEERIVLLTFERSLRPYVPGDSRVSLRDVDARLCVVRAAFGFMERPKIVPVLEGCATRGLHLDSDETSFFYAEPKFIRARSEALPAWQRGYFAFLFRNARTLTDDLEIRADRRVEIGVEVEL
jgi:KUP system potassium uptake protein